MHHGASSCYHREETPSIAVGFPANSHGLTPRVPRYFTGSARPPAPPSSKCSDFAPSSCCDVQNHRARSAYLSRSFFVMSAPSVPSIPPRPVRSQKEPRSSGVGHDAPQIPPRPARATDRPSSPHRDSFARSPLNESTFALNGGGHHLAQTLNATSPTPSQDESTLNLPSIGQEGNEYAAFFEKQPQGAPSVSEPRLASTATTATRNVVRDLELHAPKPALPKSSAKARIATVTRTDSSQAAAAGIGKAHEDDKDPHGRSLKKSASFASENSLVSSERTTSTQPDDVEHGIPEIGQRVPMYPNAGDVQAPSPAAFGSIGAPSAAGVLVEAHQRSARHHHHGRTRSSRDHLQPPPGSYGLHGHGTPSHDRFERAWYEKHPEALEHEEHGEYGPGIGGGRGEFALSREELDRIVRETASKGAGVGTSPAVLGTPLEEIGYIASESYTAKLASPRPGSSYPQRSHTPSDAPAHAHTHADSPSRKGSGSADLAQGGGAGAKTSRPHSQLHESSDKAPNSEDDDENVIHIDPPAHRSDMVGGGGSGSGGYDPSAEDLGSTGGNMADEGGWVDERGYGVPILASDEVAKEPGSDHMYPAVSPPLERSASELHGGGWDADAHWSHISGISRTESRNSSTSGSRTNSRPTSMVVLNPGYPRHLAPDEAEDAMGTPLEDVEEYEPLFPEQEEDEDDDGRAPCGHASKRQAKKRFPLRPNGLLKQRFPSEDVWEDAPSSAQLQATITTPALIEDDAQTIIADKDDEHAPPQDVDRSRPEGDALRVRFEDDGLDLSRRHFKPDVLSELPERLMSKQRFPSRDIWEDSPSSLQLETVVSTPQPDEFETPVDTPVETPVDADKIADRAQSPAKERAGPPAIPARPSRSKKSSPVAMSPQPGIPPRPAKRVAPAGPELDAAAASTRRQDAADGSPTRQTESRTELGKTNTASASSLPSAFASARRATPPTDRPKPPVPARPSKPAVGDGSGATPLARPSAFATFKGSTGSASEDGGPSAAAGSAVPPAPRPKPAVPARPNGSKIASLKAGFMSDLDKRLQMGPRAVKSPEKAADEAADEAEAEKDKEKAPLSDIRKGRARGPARRRPGTSPSTVAPVVSEETPSTGLGMAQPRTVWQITCDGRLDVAGDRLASSGPSPDAGFGGGPPLATNTAGETLDEFRAKPSERPDPAGASVPVGQAEAVPGLTSTAPAEPTSPTEKAASPSPAAAASTNTTGQVPDETG